MLDQDLVEYFGIERWRGLTEEERNIASFAFRNNTVNVSDAQRVVGRTWKTCKSILDQMAKKKILVFEPGKYQRDPKARYTLPESQK